MIITTDNKWKSFRYRDEVPQKILNDNFSHLDEDVTHGFFRYKGVWYHLYDFLRVERGNPLYKEGVDLGYASDSYFSGVLLRVHSEGDKYIVSTYTC